MMSPTLGVGLLTCLPTTRSACCDVTVTLAWLLLESGSSWPPLITAVLDRTLGGGGRTLATIWRVAVPLLARAPMVQMRVAWSKVPALAIADTKLRPAGSASVTFTPVALAGPLLVAVRV